MVTVYHNLKKDFYKEHKRVEQRTWDEIDKFLNLHQIKFSGFDLPKPIYSLDEINFPSYIMDELRMQGISRPTAIQSMTWPALYSGRDLMCIGLPTHSRVISYICPALVYIKEQEVPSRKAGPLVLIATQTKEVAKEILTQSQMFIQQSLCTFCCLFDDENINTQSLSLRNHEPDIIIGNYHRLCELLDSNLINLKNVSFLIMDDFYRNRSARLSDEIKRVVNETRSDRQTAIFSRIVPSGLQKSNGDEFQNDAVFICVGNDDIHVVHKDLPQDIHICTMAEKKKKLQDIITEISEKERNFKILVYANGFKKIRITEKIIKELGIDTFAYERTNVGRRRRAMKEKVYYNFNATPNSVLVASDVVSSKVELPDLNYIINADFPVNLSLYLNRMRMSNVKKYISIFIAEDARHADRLIYVLNECRQEVPQILYKISEAYTNSGKDVDRMPSLQEINEGLTKPVEKPIPKPLPPTISSLIAEGSSLNPTTQTQKPTETLDVILPTSPSPPLETKLEKRSPDQMDSEKNTQPSAKSPPTQKKPSPIFSTPVSSGGYKRLKSYHHTPSPQTQTAASSYRHSSNFYTQNQNKPPYQHYKQPIIQNYSQVGGGMPHMSHSPYYQAQQPIYGYPNQVLTYPPTSNQPIFYQNPAYPLQAPVHQLHNFQNQTSYNSAPVYQQQMQYQTNVNIQQQLQVKSEPSIPENLKNNSTLESTPHFTNPIPFKQEPRELSPGTTSTACPPPATKTSAEEDSNAISIVTHLLKDKQILNQLEKVARSFQAPTGYQGTWNFKTQSS